MDVQKHISALDLTPGDRVVTAVTFEDKVIVITARGVLFTLTQREYRNVV